MPSRLDRPFDRPCRRYEVRVDGEPVDPERFLAAGAPEFGAPLQRHAS
jgi:hypothetical protein